MNHQNHHAALVEQRRGLAKKEEPDQEAIKALDKKIAAASDLLNARVIRKPSAVIKRLNNQKLAYA